MKKRILFVDDETMVLQGLQRMLRIMRNEWEMEFLDSGAKALKAMGTAPFDVVVSDMRMPGMNGAELLLEIMKQSPKTVRLILSGHADQDMVLKCVGSTHQYLSKPCDPEMLKKAISRAFELEASLQVQSLRQLASQMQNLPSIPSLYVEILEKLRNPEVGLEEVAGVIAKDLGMTAKIMKLANSAFFGVSREVSNPLDAVKYIGLDTVKSLVLSVHAFSQFEKIGISAFSIEDLWSHSQATAAAAMQIAKIEGANASLQGEAFVAGLLHDTGKLILASNFSKLYDQVIERHRRDSAPLLVCEEQAFGANHADIGGYLLGLWGLPSSVVAAIAFHHSAAKTMEDGFTPLTAVYAANLLVQRRIEANPPPRTRKNSEDLLPQDFGNRVNAWGNQLNSSTNLN